MTLKTPPPPKALSRESLKATPARDVELRCPSHLHGVAEDRPGGYVLSVKCHQCSKRAGVAVFHHFDTRTWRMLPTGGEVRGG